jgi:hypothetical protein
LGYSKRIVQLEEQQSPKPQIRGSRPSSPASKYNL